MAQNRSERLVLSNSSLSVQMELLRQSKEASEPRVSEKEENRIPLFWRIFGGTVLSITALVVMTAYQSQSANLADLGRQIDHLETDMRKEMGRLVEMHAELLRKDECESSLKGVSSTLDEIKEDRKGILEVTHGCDSLLAQQRDAVKQRGKLHSEIVEVREHLAVAQQRTRLREELARLRERLVSVENVRPTSMPPVRE